MHLKGDLRFAIAFHERMGGWEWGNGWDGEHNHIETTWWKRFGCVQASQNVSNHLNVSNHVFNHHLCRFFQCRECPVPMQRASETVLHWPHRTYLGEAHRSGAIDPKQQRVTRARVNRWKRQTKTQVSFAQNELVLLPEMSWNFYLGWVLAVTSSTKRGNTDGFSGRMDQYYYLLLEKMPMDHPYLIIMMIIPTMLHLYINTVTPKIITANIITVTIILPTNSRKLTNVVSWITHHGYDSEFFR